MPNKKKRHHSSGHHSVLAPHPKSQKKITTYIPEIMAENIEGGSSSPGVKQLSLEDKVSKILEMVQSLPCIQEDMKNISKELKEHQKSIEWLHEEVEDLKVKVSKEAEGQTSLNSSMTVHQGAIEECKSEINKLKMKLTKMEAYSRRDNLLFFGISEEINENCTDKVSLIITEHMGLENIKFTRVHRLGQFKAGLTRPVIAKFHFFPDRAEVWRRKYKLKGTSVVIKEDYPESIQAARKSLIPVYNHLKFTGAKAKIIQDSILVDGKLHSAHDLPENLSPRKVSEREVVSGEHKYLLFAGKGSPFSNWYSSSFMIDGKTFSSSEQYYAYQKSIFVNDEARAKKILDTPDPTRIKKISSQLKINKQEWFATRGINAMKEALHAKFSQNPDLKEFLMSTRGTTLVECTRDKTWGCGHNLYSKEADDPNNWDGSNQLGELLIELRQTIC